MEKKDIDKKIEDLRKEFNNKIDQLKEDYKNELKEKYKKEKSEKWIPKDGEIYYYLAMDFSVSSCVNLFDWIDRTRFKFSKIFKTKEEAQEYATYLKARKEYSYEFSREEWESDGIDKYSIYCDYDYNNVMIGLCNTFRNLNQIYFKTEEKAQAFIDKYKKQILKFEFGIEE